MITAPKISISIPPLKGSSHHHNVANVSISDPPPPPPSVGTQTAAAPKPVPLSTGITKIITPNEPVVFRTNTNSNSSNIDLSAPSSINIVRRHSFRKEQAAVPPTPVFNNVTSYTHTTYNQQQQHSLNVIYLSLTNRVYFKHL